MYCCVRALGPVGKFKIFGTIIKYPYLITIFGKISAVKLSHELRVIIVDYASFE